MLVHYRIKQIHCCDLDTVVGQVTLWAVTDSEKKIGPEKLKSDFEERNMEGK